MVQSGLFIRVSDDHDIELAKHLHGYLGPFSEQGHDPTTEHHTCERIHKLPEAPLAHLGAKQELVSKKLDESRVQKDTRAERVENTGDDRRVRRARVVRRAHAEAHRDTQGRRDAIEERADVGYVAVFMREDEVREPGANAEAFERLCDSAMDERSSLRDGNICDGGNVRWKMMTTKRTLNLSSTANVSPIRTLNTGSVSRGEIRTGGEKQNTYLCKMTPNSRMATPIS